MNISSDQTNTEIMVRCTPQPKSINAKKKLTSDLRNDFEIKANKTMMAALRIMCMIIKASTGLLNNEMIEGKRGGQ